MFTARVHAAPPPGPAPLHHGRSRHPRRRLAGDRIERLRPQWLERALRPSIIASGSQLVAVISDFVPEAIAPGAAGASGSSLVLLLALLMVLQNLPEGFNAYRELADSEPSNKKRLPWLFLALVPLGPISGALGFLFLADSPATIGGLMLFASGGILYLIFQDIAPQAKLKRAFAPPLGAILGFLFGLVCHQMVG